MQLRIALAQINTVVGDLNGNADRIVEWTRRSADAGAHLVIFPEMAVTGYPVEDLALRPSFVDASVAQLEALAGRLADEGLGDLPALVGYLDRGRAGALNAAALLHHGRVVLRTAKHHLPTYGVFDEARHFTPGTRLPVFRLHGVDIAVAICEDLWQDGGPLALTREAGARLLAVLNASPYERGKSEVRRELCARRARETGAVMAYCNLVGAQDELVFDGASMVVGPNGELLASARQFEEQLLVADLDFPDAVRTVRPWRTLPGLDDETRPAGPTVERTVVSESPLAPYERLPASLAPALDPLAEVYAALVCGVRDYVRKNGFRSVILGLSGGVDSALVATLAADAIGPGDVHAVLLPSRYSSEHSITDADELVKRQGLNARTVPIRTIVDAFEAEIDLHGLAAENLQARVRGAIWMALSNEHGHLVLTTGNKSEIATGYSTLYGDSAGGFAPLKDVSKTLVWQLCRWRNEQTGPAAWLHPFGTAPIPQHIIDKPPSAELRPDQLDSDSLPPYEVLDPLLRDYVENDGGSHALIAAGHDPDLVDRVVRLVDLAEYKRRQYPPGPKITAKNFGRDRRLPITSGWREGGSHLREREKDHA
ncbi:NAD+ synthase [Streptomyces cyaneus]|uniref:NAD+ synthase n=1 Tax=Streptomyces cyaneus TaxID=1904 RepID=UPI001FEADE3F|nr:NAD+ synthase [Streptomyces cyaneus]